MTDREIFIQNLKRFIVETGCNQQDIAKAVGVSDKTVSAWVNGRGYPRANVMQKLAEYFGVRLSDIVDLPTNESDELQLIHLFRSLNLTGKAKLLERAEELVYLYGGKGSTVPNWEVG